MTEVLHGLGAAERQRVSELRAQGRFFWVDVSLGETGEADVIDALGVPERALPAFPDAFTSRTFQAERQSIVFALLCYVRAETDVEDVYRLQPLEVRVVVTHDFVLTLHDERVSLPAALAPDLPEERSRPYVLFAVLDAMLGSTFDALEEVELTLDALAATGTDAGGVPRAPLRAAAARLATMRRRVTAEQAVFERIPVELGTLPGFDADGERYFERLDEQVDRLLAAIDAAASGMGMLLDLQLNERAYVVSVVATIFVPLTFITGFFGMNFGWMVDHIDSEIAFWLVGIVVPIAAAALSWRFLLRRFLTGADPKARSR